ncbi:MAG: preprotein translocase subunit SecE [Bythopirellula sp.]|nr:preprotein translocase subunit SecE [Bythopirellula sp.]
MAELITGMFHASRYKRSQGKIARQVTFAAIALVFAVAAWNMFGMAQTDVNRYVIPSIVFAVGAWIAFRIVNIPSFADFLISVEAEMNKVSWPGRTELWRASMVVIVVIFLLAAILFTYDLVLRFIVGKIFGL